MAAMAPALTDAPAEARHIRLKLAAENNGNSTNLLLSSAISPSDTAGTNGKPHHEDNRRRCCNGKEPLSEPLSLGKLQPLVASYLCSHVGPVAEEGVLIKQSVLKNRGLLNGDLLLRTQLSGGQPKSFVNGRGAGTGTGGGNAMVPVNGLAKKAAVPSTALPEKGSVATLNGDNAKPPTGAGALLPLSSKSGDVIPTISAPRADSKHLRELGGDMHSRAPEDTGVNASSENPQIKSETPPSDRSHAGRAGALSETNNNASVSLDAPQSSSFCQHSCSPSSPSPSSGVEALVLRERAQQSQRRQADVSARLQRLCKRLQVVQAKQVERHVKQQLTGFLHHTLSQSSSSRQDSIAQLLKDSSLPSELEKLHLSGTTSLQVAEAQFDSDATESSSGGESDIEEEELARVDTEQRHVKLWRRAEGRFAVERASIISRWTWLQAHISDLEYRIRQHTDIYRQIRASKGSVELGDSSHQTKTEKAKPQNATGDLGQTNRFSSDRSMNEFFHSAAEVSDVKLPPTPETGCSSARVRPLISCKRRRLVQPGVLQNFNTKVQRVCSPARPCDVNGVCMMCGGSQGHPKPELQFERPLVDNVAVQDPCVHPTLSLQSDIPLGTQLQRVLKSHWQTRHMEKVKPLKKLSLKHKLSHYSSSSSSTSALSKHKFRLSSSPMAAIRFSSHKNRSERPRKQVEAGTRLSKLDAHTPCRTGRLLDRSLSRKRVRENSLDRPESPKLQFDAGSPYPPSQPSSQPSTPSAVSRQMCLPSDSSTPLGPSSQPGSCSMPIRKRRSENSFDINNIVIPMSVAATTRVEKLQYKEIITPSWREVGMFPQPVEAEDENVEVEDLSDAAVMQRHQKCEDQERSRWRWTALTPAKRRGSRSYKSLDGRTTPSLIGTNPSTPQPSSPDTGHFHLLQDYGPVPSPLSPPSPDTPCSRDAHTPSSRDSYTPHMRDAHRPVYSEDTRCSTPDGTFEERTVQPWEHRSFPLSEDPVLEPKADPRPHQRFSCGAESESETSSA